MSERKEAFFRIIVAIVSGVILSIWAYLIIILAIINWLIAIFANKRNENIAEFCEYWNTESYKFYKYLIGLTNNRPFPFTDLEKIGKFERNMGSSSNLKKNHAKRKFINQK